jgi:hypothetical protein
LGAADIASLQEASNNLAVDKSMNSTSNIMARGLMKKMLGDTTSHGGPSQSGEEVDVKKSATISSRLSK